MKDLVGFTGKDVQRDSGFFIRQKDNDWITWEISWIKIVIVPSKACFILVHEKGVWGFGVLPNVALLVNSVFNN
jgi:hypothetical protein